MVAHHPDIDVQLGLRDRVESAAPGQGPPDPPDRRRRRGTRHRRPTCTSVSICSTSPGGAPRTLNLDGAFGLLSTVAWANLGPVAVVDLEDVRLRVRLDGDWLEVHGLDKFPRMTDGRGPQRRANRRRRPVAAPTSWTGTVVMHEGFVNFNGGTLGTSMVEGRIYRASSWVTAPTSVAAPRSWARCRRAAPNRSPSANGACSVPTPDSGSAARY